MLIAQPLEDRFVRFDPRRAAVARKGLRYGICVALVLGTLRGLDPVFPAIAPDATLLGESLRYLRYRVAGMAGMLVAPFLFVRWGLASRLVSPGRATQMH